MAFRQNPVDRRCRICHAPLTSQGITSEVAGGAVCADCARIERIGFIWCSIGVVVIASLWAIVLLLYRHGIVSETTHYFFSLWWQAIWIFACLLGIYFRLNKRKQLRKTNDDDAKKART